MAGNRDTPNGNSAAWDKPIGALDNMPGFRGTIPIWALGFGGDSHYRGDDVVLQLALPPEPGLRDKLLAIGTKRTISIVNIYLGQKKYWLKNVRVRGLPSGTWGVHLDLYFDYTPEARQLIFHVKNHDYDPYFRLR